MPEDMCSKSRIVIFPYGASFNSGTYFAAASPTEPTAFSETATPINMAVIVFAMDCEVNRSRSVRPY